MRETITVYGTQITLPEQPPINEIDGFDLPVEEQVWRRRELPDIFDNIKYDSDGNAILNSEQAQYASQEVKRCKEGYWFFCGGKPLYITGKSYFYLTYWKLEDDIYPDFRMADRRYFLFMHHWENVLWCLGIARGKKRREGASSQATSNLVYEAIFYTNSNCGLVSKTQIDSRDTFTDMVRAGYQALPVFLKPRQVNHS